MKKMEIIYKKLGEIKPYERNPRVNDAAIDAVAASIKDFGFKVPIIIDMDGVIVCGHTRYKAASKLGLTEVPTISAADLTLRQIKAFRLADNKTGELASWDFSMLEVEMGDLGDYDLAQFGFTNNFDNSNFIDDLEGDDFKEFNYGDKFYNCTFTFPVEEKDRLLKYVKENGKDTIVAMIIDKIHKE